MTIRNTATEVREATVNHRGFQHPLNYVDPIEQCHWAGLLFNQLLPTDVVGRSYRFGYIKLTDPFPI